MHAPRLAQLAAEHAGARDSLASALGQESAALQRYRQSLVRGPCTHTTAPPQLTKHSRPRPTDERAPAQLTHTLRSPGPLWTGREALLPARGRRWRVALGGRRAARQEGGVRRWGRRGGRRQRWGRRHQP
jgi:hypothetical protein